jgi:hypothetical protein
LYPSASKSFCSRHFYSPLPKASTPKCHALSPSGVDKPRILRHYIRHRIGTDPAQGNYGLVTVYLQMLAICM